MDLKHRSHSAKDSVPAAVKRAKGIAETARLFLDVDEMIRRSQSQRISLSRYVE